MALSEYRKQTTYTTEEIKDSDYDPSDEFVAQEDFISVVDSIEADVKALIDTLDGVEGIDIIDDVKDQLEQMRQKLY